MRKRQFEDLAIAGGAPAFIDILHVGRPNIGDRAELFSRLQHMLDRRWLTNQGPLVTEFEQQIAQHLAVRHCILTSSATVGLQVVAHALDLTGSVIVPAFTFVATVHAMRWIGLRPIFCDVDPSTHNLDPAQAEALVVEDTTGIVATHLWGRPCDVDALEDLAARRGLRLMLDAAHAFGCTHGGVPVGRFGAAEVFSFHATKLLNAFEGGAITTDDDDLAERLRLGRNFGFSDYDRVAALGTNAKMSEASAAMGLTSLSAIDRILDTNRENMAAYRGHLDGLSGVSLIDFSDEEQHNMQYVVCEVDEGEAGLSRDRLMDVLHAENVLARRYFYPGCHRSEPYRSEDSQAATRLPVTESLAQRVLVLPTGTAITVVQIEVICGIIRLAVETSARLASRRP